MYPGIILTSRPLAPACPSGKPGGFGIVEATLTLPRGVAVWGRGLSHQAARVHALRRASLEYAELLDHLTACELEAQAEEAGILDPRD